MEKVIFSAPEIAKICKVTRHTVNAWIRKGIISAFRPMEKGAWKVTRKTLITFMNDRGYPQEFLNGNRIKILVIDDEKIVTRTIDRPFKNDDRFLVGIANSGFAAGSKLETFKPDLVILDIYLGDMDGREFCNHIRNHRVLNETKIIGISGKLDEDETLSLLKQGFNAFLHKPFRIDILKETISKVLE